MSASLVFTLLFLFIVTVEPTVDRLVVTRNYSVRRLYTISAKSNWPLLNPFYSVRSLTIHATKEIALHLSVSESSTACRAASQINMTHLLQSVWTGLIQTHTPQMRDISTLVMWYDVHSSDVTSLTLLLLVRTNVSSGFTRYKINCFHPFVSKGEDCYSHLFIIYKHEIIYLCIYLRDSVVCLCMIYISMFSVVIISFEKQ